MPMGSVRARPPSILSEAPGCPAARGVPVGGSPAARRGGSVRPGGSRRRLRGYGRAADLTKQLLAFSRQQVLQPKVVDINTIVGGMENMLARLLGARGQT